MGISLTDRRRLKLQGAFACNTVESLHAAALAGVGIARLPAFLIGEDVEAGASEADSGGIYYTVRRQRAAIYAVRPAAESTMPAARVFIDFLVSRFQPVPPWQMRANRLT